MEVLDSQVLTFDDIVKYTVSEHKDVLWIDVRKPHELLEKGSIPGTINIPLDDLTETLQKSDPEAFKEKYKREAPLKTTQLVFSCNSGGRASKAFVAAIELGYVNSKIYKGGWLDWSKHQDG